MIGIYKITNPKGKVYIGQSVDIKNRWNSYHKRECKTQIKLNRSFIKYGIDKHLFEILEICTIDLLNERERYWQDKYCVIKNGLNCRLTTSKDKSGVFSQEAKKRMSESAKMKKLTDEHKKNISKNHSKHNLGKKHTKETIEKISLNRKGIASRKGAVLSDETKNKIRISSIGRKHSEQTKIKMSLDRKGKKQSKETIEKRANTNKRIILNQITGIYYFGIDEIHEQTGMKKSTLSEKLRGATKNNTNFIYV